MILEQWTCCKHSTRRVNHSRRRLICRFRLFNSVVVVLLRMDACLFIAYGRNSEDVDGIADGGALDARRHGIICSEKA